jgi:hypothetical protein
MRMSKRVVNILEGFGCPVLRMVIKERRGYKIEESDPWMSIASIPQVASLNINRLFAVLQDSGSHMSSGVMLSILIEQGLNTIEENNIVSTNIKLHEEFNRLPGSVPPQVSRLIASFMEKTEIATIKKGSRRNLQLPRDLHTRVSVTCRLLGIKWQYELVVLSLMESLSHATSTYQADREELTTAVEGFYEHLNIRSRAVKVLLDEFIPEREK